jgi:HAAS
MMVATTQVTESLQTLIDSRLDTIDRMLLGRLPRSERLEVVREVEGQIHELLGERGSDDLTREDVLAVLARLDPPEAYLPEGEAEYRSDVGPRKPFSAPIIRPAPKPSFQAGKVAGIVGILSICLVMFAPLGFGLAMLTKSEILTFFLWLGAAGLMFVGGIISLSLGIYARMNGPWAIVGLVAGVVSILISSVGGLWLAVAMMS